MRETYTINNREVAAELRYIPNMANQSITIAAVQAIIVHEFNDPSLLTESLQAAGSQITFAGTRAIPDGNKRLALLGDTVLKLALLDHWYERGGSRGSPNPMNSHHQLVLISRQSLATILSSDRPATPTWS